MDFVADLERHEKTVNVVRFAPSNELLASGDDSKLLAYFFMILLQLVIDFYIIYRLDHHFVDNEGWTRVRSAFGQY